MALLSNTLGDDKYGGRELRSSMLRKSQHNCKKLKKEFADVLSSGEPVTTSFEEREKLSAEIRIELKRQMKSNLLPTVFFTAVFIFLFGVLINVREDFGTLGSVLALLMLLCLLFSVVIPNTVGICGNIRFSKVFSQDLLRTEAFEVQEKYSYYDSDGSSSYYVVLNGTLVNIRLSAYEKISVGDSILCAVIPVGNSIYFAASDIIV